MIPDVTPNGVFYLPPTGWLTSFYNLPFLYQEEWAALTEITKYSSFPYFSTNITTANPRQRTSKDDRVRLPITDEAATMTFYANYRKKQKSSLTPLLNEINQNWPNLS